MKKIMATIGLWALVFVMPSSVNGEGAGVALDTESSPAAAAVSSQVALQLNWSSVSTGGTVGAVSGVYELGSAAGQSATGSATSAVYDLDAGFWALSSDTVTCPVAMTGDVNISTTLTSADIIYLVNYVFKSLATPLPCAAAGDVNCSGTVTSADIIFMVNHVFKSQAAPCDVCLLIAVGTWSCP